MKLQGWDYILIILFFLLLLSLFLFFIRKKSSYPSFFNAGGKLHWIWIGASLLGANIQIEYILGVAAKGFSEGLAYGSYEWTAAFVLIFAAFYIYPYFLRVGVITLPEYLEVRFNKPIRVIMASLFMLVNFGMIVLILNSSAIFIEKLFGFDKMLTICIITIAGALIIYAGGMELKLRLDLIVISCFLIVGILLLVFCLIEAGGIDNFYLNSSGRLRAVLPADDKNLPWTSVFLGGLWVNHLFYWCFFQPVSQGALASNSLSHTQKGLLLVATIKLAVPFILLIPGIVGYELFADQISHPDFALPVVIANVVPIGLGGIIILGYIGTLFTTYNSFLHATVTIFSLDIFKNLSLKNRTEEQLIKSAKIFIPVFSILAIVLGAFFDPTDLIFHYSQLLLVSTAPINTSVFLFAIFSRRTPNVAPYFAVIAGFPLFFILKNILDITLLNLSGLVFVILVAIMLLIRFIFPLQERIEMPEKFEIKFERNLVVVIWGLFILTCVFGIYAIFI